MLIKWNNTLGLKLSVVLMLSVMLIIGMVVPAAAETISGDTKSEVVFTADSKLESTFHDNVVDDMISEYLEPGDTAIFTIELKNANAESVDFWMDQRTIDSLESWGNDELRKGGGYTYLLTYDGPGGARTLYSSLQVAGEDFQENTDSSMKVKKIDEDSYVYLDTYATGQGGVLTLQVSLDGESQGNDYQATLANLAMSFAVEQNGEVIKTGDTNNALPYFIVMTAAGLVILVIVIVLFRNRRKNRRAAWEIAEKFSVGVPGVHLA